jgi:hypothetical protein
MKFLIIFNRLIIYFFYFLLVSIFFFTIYIVNTSDPFIKSFRKEFKSVIKKGNVKANFFNNYRVEHLPNTQFTKINFKKIKLDFIDISNCHIGSCYTFYIEQYNENLIIADRKGDINFIKFSELKNKKVNYKKISTNLDFDRILDTFVMNDHIYVSGKKTLSEDVTEIQIVKGKINENSIKFKKLIGLSSDKCIFKYSVHSGKIQSFKGDNNKLLLSVNSSGWTDNPSMESLDPNSICGKILLIDINSKNYEVYSSGHRNIIGLYSDKNVILSTEHGPYSGDEINNIKNKKSYGWPVASYGERYSRGNSDDGPFYKKNHKSNGFVEPIFSFIPAIGISEIIKLPNNFSNMWQDNFLVSSLNAKKLHRVKFDQDYNKIIYSEEIYIGDRMRDLLYDSKNRKIILALELTGSLGILTNTQ